MKRVCDEDCFHCKYEDCINDYVKPERSEAQKWYDRERMREKRALYRKYGICVKCFHREAFEGHTLCEECTEKQRLYNEKHNRKRIFDKRETRAAEGLCYFCGAPRLDGYRVCKACYDRCKRNTPTTRKRSKEVKKSE